MFFLYCFKIILLALLNSPNSRINLLYFLRIKSTSKSNKDSSFFQDKQLTVKNNL
jgi:hypothetical protein